MAAPNRVSPTPQPHYTASLTTTHNVVAEAKSSQRRLHGALRRGSPFHLVAPFGRSLRWVIAPLLIAPLLIAMPHAFAQDNVLQEAARQDAASQVTGNNDAGNNDAGNKEGGVAAGLGVATNGATMTLTPLRGSPTIGQLVGVGQDGTLQWLADGTTRPLDLTSVRAMEGAAVQEASAAAWIELVDGSLLVAEQIRSQSADAEVTLVNGTALKLPLVDIAKIQFAGQPKGTVWESLGQSDRGDMLLVRRSSGALDQIFGAVMEIGDEAVRFDLDGQEVRAPRAKLQGLTMRLPKADRAMPATIAQVTDADGMRWSVQSFNAAEENKITLRSVTGLESTYPLTALRRILPIGNERSLGSLETVERIYDPFVKLPIDVATISDALGPRWSDDGASLQLMSRSRLTLRLPGDLPRLVTTVAAAEGGQSAGAILRISVDDAVKYEQTWLPTSPSQPLEIDVSGGRRLVIELDYGEGGDGGDVVVLQEARLLK
jgi:hypothetical protein